jgi:uncharacterized membrane protein
MSEQKSGSGLEPNVAGFLCYLLWWITGIVFLVIEKDDKTVRFHAWQSIITFGAISILQIILNFIPVIGWIIGLILWIASVILWIILMVKAYQGELYKLPVIGDIAAKQAGV